MITHLPYDDFARCAAILPYDMLDKQLSDAHELLVTEITGRAKLRNSPYSVMWRDCPVALWRYIQAMGVEFDKRGGGIDVLSEVSELIYDSIVAEKIDAGNSAYQPWWLGLPTLHLSHRSMLLHKRPDVFAKKFAPEVIPALPYFYLDYQTPVLIPKTELISTS